MKKSITYKRLHKFDVVATAYLIENGYYVSAISAIGETPSKAAKYTDKVPTKLVANIKNIIKQTDALYEDFNEKKTIIFIDNALEDDKTKAILYDDTKDGNGNVVRNYKFSKDGQKKVNEEVKKLMNEEVEIHVRITEGELGLTEEEKDAFNGIVIPEFTPDED